MFPFRYITCVVCVLISIAAYFSRSNLSIAVVAMTSGSQNDTNPSDVNLCPSLEPRDRESNTTAVKAEFDWSPELQGNVLGCFYWTYCVFQIPFGYIAGRFGGRIPLTFSFIATAVLSALGPTLARKSAYMFIAGRAFMGVFQAAIYPGMFVLILEWFPIKERSMAMATAAAAIHLGNIVLYFSSGFMIEKFTWSVMFYFPAIVSAVMFFVTGIFLRNKPEEHFMVSAEEAAYIRKEQVIDVSAEELEEDVRDDRRDSFKSGEYSGSKESLVTRYAIPWVEILRNKAFLAMIAMKFARYAIYTIVTANLPAYFNRTLNQSLVEVGINFAVFTGILFLSTLVFTRISELVIVRGWCSRTTCRKLFCIISGFGSSISFMLIPVMRCNLSAVKFLFYLYAACSGAELASDGMIPAEIAKHFAAIIFSMANIATIIPGFIAPLIVGLVIGSLGQEWLAWDVIFHSFGALGLIASLIFMIFVSADIQDFDNVDGLPVRDVRSMSFVSAMSLTPRASF